MTSLKEGTRHVWASKSRSTGHDAGATLSCWQVRQTGQVSRLADPRSDGTLRSSVYGMCARRAVVIISSSEYSSACDYGNSARAPRSKLCLAKPIIRWHCCIDDEVTTTGKQRRQACNQTKHMLFLVSQASVVHFVPNKRAQTPLLRTKSAPAHRALCDLV